MSANQLHRALIEHENLSVRVRDRNADRRLRQNRGQELALQGERPIRLPHLFGGLSTNPGHRDRAGDAGQELSRRERLREIIVGPLSQSFDLRFFSRARRQHYDREVRESFIVANGREKRETVHPGHHHIGKKQVGSSRARRLQGGVAIRDRLDRIAARFEQAAHIIAQIGVIIREEHARVIARRRLRGFAPHIKNDIVARRVGKPAQRFLDIGVGAYRTHRRLRLDLIRGQVREAEGDLHAENRAAAFLALDRDLAAMNTHKFLNERQADPRAFERAAASPLYSVEALEQPGQFRLWNPIAGVRDFKHDLPGLTPQPNRDASGQRKLERVGKKVKDDLFPHLAVDISCLRQGLAIHFER